MTGGYREFRGAPQVGGGLTSARAAVRTPYGVASGRHEFSSVVIGAGKTG